MSSHKSAGFSLVELLLALSITLGLSAMMFHLFHQNERVIRDQTLIAEMQQSARAVAAQIADELRMAGQGAPVFAASFDSAPSEAVAVILGSSTANRIDFRAGLSNVETTLNSHAPIDFAVGIPRTLAVTSGGGFAIGKFVYVWGPITGSWTWLRAETTAVSSNSLTIMPREASLIDGIVHFTAAPTISLEEAVSIYLSNGSVRRATAANFANPANPTWSAANEIGTNFTSLLFTYYDAAGDVVVPSSLAKRTSIVRVDVSLTVQTASPLSKGSRPTYSLKLRTTPRNLRMR